MARPIVTVNHQYNLDWTQVWRFQRHIYKQVSEEDSEFVFIDEPDISYVPRNSGIAFGTLRPTWGCLESRLIVNEHRSRKRKLFISRNWALTEWQISEKRECRLRRYTTFVLVTRPAPRPYMFDPWKPYGIILEWFPDAIY